jgi:predicted permease
MGSVLVLLLFLVAGYTVQHFLSPEMQEQWADRFNRFVIYISLPALVFVYMIDLKLDSRFILPVSSAWGLFLLSALLILFFAKCFGWSRSLTGALLMVAPYGNTSFLGVPFTKAFFGEAGIPYAIIYDQLGSFLILSTVGLVTLSLYSAQKSGMREILYRIFTFPAFLALLFALPMQSSMLPDWLMQLLSWLAATLTPAALLSIGLYLKLRLERDKLLPFGIGLLIKLIITPLLLLLVFQMLNLEGLTAEVSLFEAAMAPMVSSSMLAIMAGLERRFVASILGYGIVISFVTLPLWFYLLKGVL